VASRRQPNATTRKLKPKAVTKNQPPALSLPYLSEFIEDGQITISMLRSVGCIATAADEDCTYAMLLRRRGETLPQLLIRLDQALDKALTLGIFTDEINR
jgi:hypothetical protein